jgi:hypothetical protein
VEPLHRAQKRWLKTSPPPPLDTSFLVRGGFFRPPTKTENVFVPSVTSSLKSLNDHFLHSKDFIQMVGNISKAFWLVIIEKASTEELLQKSLEEVVELRGQFQCL